MELVVILDNVRSLHNVGSVFRSADVFGVSKVWLCGYTGTPPRKDISKVALGAEDWVPWEHRKSAVRLVSTLRRQGYRIISLEATAGAVPVGEVALAGKVALVLGHEIEGVSKAVLDRSDAVAIIPMRGKKESLNVSVAAGVAFYALTSRAL